MCARPAGQAKSETGQLMDIYEKLREVLDRHISGAPESGHFDGILKTLFTPDEAALAVHMKFRPQPAAKIASVAGCDEQKAVGLLESMADKGIVFSRDKDNVRGYALLPTVPGLFEFPFMRGDKTPMHDRLAKLWAAYHEEALGNEFAGSKTPFARIIPVEQTVDAQNEVMPYEALSEMLKLSTDFAVANCACRATMDRCEKPRELCLMFDQAAQFLVSRGLARPISRQEAMAVLALAEKEGLVHTTNNSGDRLNFVCNCCSCCCTILRGLTELSNPNAFAKSRWLAKVDENFCIGCGVCEEERCPMEAILLEDGIASVDEGRCIGCGLCVSACETRAISMKPRPGAIEPPATMAQMGLAIAKEKDRLEKFLGMMS